MPFSIVAAHITLNFKRPCIYTAANIKNLFKSMVLKEPASMTTANAMMTDDCQRHIRRQFTHPARKLGKWNMQRLTDRADFKFPVFPNIKQGNRLIAI
ncbi:hypothetical protein AUQ43_02645 [Thalassospira sp. MCCC 1A01148]|uniref:Uncharacterized protein n=1 Tax=Thalassospira profundimaris TaxID=502049 RepID=A0A367V693_9PROT|nr:hypothetical protein AUQ43_02645 [Thalassospira sp. MCCC 1A01148]RCK20673.1 hypothetical protein TH6_16635 [Thalassospira profundimaris]